MEQVHKIAESTLAELRAIIAATSHLPDDAIVRARVGFGNMSGGKIKHLSITTVTVTSSGTIPGRSTL